MSEAAQKLSELQPIIVEQVALKDGRALVARKPLTFYPYMSPCGKYYHADYEPLTIRLYEESYDALEAFVYEELDFIWTEYVEDTSMPLDKSAQNLRDNLLKYFSVKK